MKNALLCLLAVTILVAACLWFDSTETRYDMRAEVTYVDRSNGYAIMTDARGEMWEIVATKETREGRKATLKMDTNGTETIYDDVVVRVVWER